MLLLLVITDGSFSYCTGMQRLESVYVLTLRASYTFMVLNSLGNFSFHLYYILYKPIFSLGIMDLKNLHDISKIYAYIIK